MHFSRCASTRSQRAQTTILFPVISHSNPGLCYRTCQGCFDPSKYFVLGAEPVNFNKFSLGSEPFDYGNGLLLIETEAFGDTFWRVVGTSSSNHTRRDFVDRDFEIDGCVDRTVATKQGKERFRLGNCAREAVEQHAIFDDVALTKPFFDESNHGVVIDKTTTVQNLFNGHTHLCLGRNSGAKHVASGDMHHSKRIDDALALRAFSCSLTTKDDEMQCHSFYFKKPS